MIFLRKRDFLFSNEIIIGDGDFFIRNFKNYLIYGHYNSVVSGISVVYNLVLSFIFRFTENINETFLVLNTFSQVSVGLIGLFIIKKRFSNKAYAISFFMIYFLLFFINNDEFTDSRNDMFLSLIFSVIFLVLFRIINKKSLKRERFLIVGLLFALALGTRSFSVLFIAPYFIFVIYLFYHYKLKDVLFSQVLFLFSFIFFTITIHYPSIKENNKLSFFDKNKDQNINWIHLNTIATKKMFETNKIQLIRKDIYWEMVNKKNYENYLKTHNISESDLPNNIFEYIKYDYVNYLKLFFLNIINTLIYLVRHFGLLFIFPFIYLIKELKLNGVRNLLKNQNNLFFLMFLAFYFPLMIIMNAVIEFRWFNSFVLLFYISIIISFDYFYRKKPKLSKRLFFSSLLLLLILNCRTVLSLL